MGWFRGCFETMRKAAPGVCCLAVVAAGCMPAVAQTTGDSGAGFVSAATRSAEQMDPADKALLRAKRQEIAREADFFGYDLGTGRWDYDQVLCPDMPDHLLLHYRSRSRNGAESLFTAVVPRGKGRVRVVPVLYHNAIPFQSAAGSPRSMTVFNTSVPEQIAGRAVQPDGPWLQLAMCYAEIVGAEPQVPNRENAEPALVRAPAPNLRISEEHHTREVTFADRNNPAQYMVWTVLMNDKGRVTAATASTFADYRVHIVNPEAPPEKPLPAATNPPLPSPPQ